MKSRIRLQLHHLLGALLLCLAFAAPAQAATITGFSDENIETWSPATWSAFTTTGVRQVRHIVPYDAALRAGPLQEARDWIGAAESRGLEVLISFNHNDVSPPPSAAAFVQGMAAFRRAFPQVAYYTAWNEPNHNPSNASGANPNSNPALAADYWHAANDLCRNQPALGPTCTVIAGDFSDETTTAALKDYVSKYKARLLNTYGESPGTWAVHAYKTLRTNDDNMLQEAFVDQIPGKHFWVTEAAGMFCQTSGGYTGPGGTADNPQSAEGYHFAQNPYSPCDTSGGTWDSGLITNGQGPRAAFRSLFPNAGGAPTVQTGGATNIGTSQATLNASVDPRGFHTNYRFEWGATTAYGNSVPVPDGYAGFAAGSASLSATIGGLQPGAAYHYRIVASNAFGRSDGVDRTFTLAEPSLDGDSKADLVECVNSEYRAVLSTGSQFGTPGIWSTWGCAPLTRLGDFNGDGKLDLLSPGGGSTWAVGTSDGSWFNGSVWSTGISNTVTWLGVGDFNGDGRDDFATCLNNEYKVNLANSAGNGFLTGTTIWSTWGCSANVRVGDFNGDGKDDILVPGGGSNWVVGTSDGSHFNGWTWSTAISNTVTWHGVGDFNGDGKDDFATCLNNQYKVNLAQPANKEFIPGTTIWSTWGCSANVRVGDFSGDGKDDLAVPGANESWAVGESTGSGFNGSGTRTWQVGFTNAPAWVEVG
jgi:hypothetical protein